MTEDQRRRGRLGPPGEGTLGSGPPPISAADAVFAQITDRGITVANRTNYPIRMEIELATRGEGTPGTPADPSNIATSATGIGRTSAANSAETVESGSDPATLERLRFTLGAREEGLIPKEKLGGGAKHGLPEPVIRQWSHDRGVVYEGGELQLALVRAVFLDPGHDVADGPRIPAPRELGQAESSGGLGLGVLITAKQIREAVTPIWRD